MNKYPPAIEDLDLLPLWAKVAYSVRCARYVQGLFPKFCPECNSEYVENIETLLKTAEDAARIAKKPESMSLVPLVLHISEVAKLVEEKAQNEFVGKTVGKSAGSAVAAFCALMFIDKDHGKVTEFASSAVSQAALAAMNSIPLMCPNVEDIHKIPPHFLGSEDKPIMDTIWSEYSKLLDSSKKENWNDYTAVEPSFFDKK